MVHPLGILEEHSLSSFNYRANDRSPLENGVDRRETSMEYVISIKVAIPSTHDLSDMRSLDAHLQAILTMDENAACTSTSS